MATTDVYLGNPNLKKAGTEIQFTKKQIQEWIKCKEDPLYFACKYMQIINLDEGLVPFSMYDFQKKILTDFHENRFNIAKLPRQTGKSTTVVAYLLHYLIFNDSVNIGILANKASTARELLGRLQLAYENLPRWIQHGILVWNKGNVELENGSKILAASTSASAVRGMSFNILFLDEFAFVPNHVAEQFFASVYPTITSGKSTKVIIISTPNGMNHFYKMWEDARNGKNGYVTNEVHWSQVPGRDAKWKEETLKNTSKRQFAQEFECDFLGSADTLISPPNYSLYHLKIQYKAMQDLTYMREHKKIMNTLLLLTLPEVSVVTTLLSSCLILPLYRIKSLPSTEIMKLSLLCFHR